MRQTLWFDELLTFHISRLSSAQLIWDTLSLGADGHPSLGYLLTSLSFFLFGANEVAARLPSTCAFLGTSLLLYLWVYRRQGGLCAICGLLILWLTSAFSFGFQARPYALLLFFSTLTITCWMAGARPNRSKWALAGVALFLAAAVWSHYYGVLLLAPLATGELIRSARSRRIDWLVWMAMFGGALTLIACLPLIEVNRQLYSKGFWSVAVPEHFYTTYLYLVKPGFVWFLVVSLVLVSMEIIHLAKVDASQRGSRRCSYPPEESGVIVALAATPILVVLLGLVFTGAHVFRYAIVGALGLVMLAMMVIERASGHRRRRVLAVVVILLASFVTVRLVDDNPLDLSGIRVADLARTYEILATDPIPAGLPIAIASPIMFAEIFHYAPPRIAARVVCLSNPKAAVERFGTDTPEWNLDRISRAVGWPVKPEADFRSLHQRFLIYDAPNGLFAWLPAKIADEGKKLVPVINDRQFSIWLCCEEVAGE